MTLDVLFVASGVAVAVAGVAVVVVVVCDEACCCCCCWRWPTMLAHVLFSDVEAEAVLSLSFSAATVPAAGVATAAAASGDVDVDVDVVVVVSLDNGCCCTVDGEVSFGCCCWALFAAVSATLNFLPVVVAAAFAPACICAPPPVE